MPRMSNRSRNEDFARRSSISKSDLPCMWVRRKEVAVINDREELSEYLNRAAKNFQIEVEMVPNVCDCCGSKQGKDEIIEHLMSEYSEMTFTMKIKNSIYENCRVSISRDGKRMKWFNDKTGGVIKLK